MVIKSEGIPLTRRPGKRQKITALINVVILCVVIIMSVMLASGVFKKDSPPAEGNDVNGNDGNVVRTAIANVHEMRCSFPLRQLNLHVLLKGNTRD
jgi:hypothetical protein